MTGSADDDADLRVSSPPTHAAGVPAVLSALRHGLHEMGPLRTARTLTRINQTDGFDCMGCAWPDPAKRHHAEFCENGAKAVAEEATRLRADRDFFAQWSVEQIAERSDYWIGKRGRLTEPMHLAPGASRYVPIGWDEAYAIVADELSRLDSPDEAAFYTSGRTSNEAAFAYQALVRAFGTNNLPDCSNMCHESSGVALANTIGIGKGSVSIEDVEHADLLLIVGQNPGTNHPRMLSSLERAKQSGARIVSINPLLEAGLTRFDNPQRPSGVAGRGTKLADLHLPVRINGDLALFRAVNRRLIERDAVDRAFIERYADGFAELRAQLLAGDDEQLEAVAGLSAGQVEQLVDLIVASERMVICWAMGLTQHRNAVATIQEVVNTALLRGMIGKPGAGLCPVRGHSNVQGDRTMGIYEKPAAAFLDRLQATLGFAPPRAHGYDVVETIRAMREGRVKVLMAMGGNFLSAAPDTDVTAAALRGCRLTVHVATKPNRSHVTPGRQALLLPTLGRSERDRRGGREQRVSVEDSMSVVHASRGRLAPAAPALRSEVAIVCELARRLLGERTSVPWEAWADDYDLLRDAIAATIPGFERFNERLDEGFVLPHPPRDELRFETATGRARLTVNELDAVAVAVGEGELLLQTLRSHDQYNTTIYGLNDRYRGIKAGRRVVLVHPADIRALGFAAGDVVDLVGVHDDGVERRAERFRLVDYDTPRGCAAAYYPETNALVPLDAIAVASGTPASKSVVIRLRPHAG